MVTLDEKTMSDYLAAHNLTNVGDCSKITENRFRDENDLYCWRGIVSQNEGKDCMMATTCSPYSYSSARDIFCLDWGCQVGQYKAPLPGDPTGVENPRGGFVVDMTGKDCRPGVQDISCIISGISQSVTNSIAPTNRTSTFLHLGGFFVVLMIAAYTYRKHGKKFGLKSKR